MPAVRVVIADNCRRSLLIGVYKLATRAAARSQAVHLAKTSLYPLDGLLLALLSDLFNHFFFTVFLLLLKADLHILKKKSRFFNYTYFSRSEREKKKRTKRLYVDLFGIICGTHRKNRANEICSHLTSVVYEYFTNAREREVKCTIHFVKICYIHLWYSVLCKPTAKTGYFYKKRLRLGSVN